MMKVALIGIGGMGGVHFNCYRNIKNAEVVAVCDVRTEMAEEKVNDKKVHIYSDMDELLANEQVDMVDICTPSYMHREMSIKALERGINVLCEKPMSLNTADTAAIMEAAEKSGKTFMVAHVLRFESPYVVLKQVIDSEKFGKLLRLDMKRISEVPRWSWENWMRDVKKSGGTPIDLAIHDIDFVRWQFGEPKDVSGFYHKLKNDNDFMAAEFVYDDFAVSTEAGWYDYPLPFAASYKAIFERGMLEYVNDKIYENGKELQLNTEETQADTGINISNVDGYSQEIEYYIGCIEKGEKPCRVTPESSHESVKLIERFLNNASII